MRQIAQIPGIVSALPISAQALALGLADLSGRKRSRALEDVRCCGARVTLRQRRIGNAAAAMPEKTLPHGRVGAASNRRQTGYGAVGR